MMGVFALQSWFIRPVDEDWVDHVNGFWTVLLLSTCAVGSFLVRFITAPIACWVPAQFTSSMSFYVHEKCFLQENYTPTDHTKSIFSYNDPISSYHLWIPLILFFQAFCFFVPKLFWRCLKNHMTIDTGSIMATLENTQTILTPESKTIVYQNVAVLISNVLRRNNFLLALMYLGTKVFYCLNLVGQFAFLLTHFKHELVIQAGLKAGIDISGYIRPLLLNMGLCSYEVTDLGTTTAFVSQCLLPISEIYEKLFVFLSYWVLFLLIITSLSLILWATLLFVPYFRNRKLSIYIHAFNTNSQNKVDENDIKPFISGFLGVSGIFMLHSISNSNEIIAAELTSHLFEEFKESQVHRAER